MRKSNTPKLNLDGENAKHGHKEVEEHVDELYQHAKHKARELYEESKKSVSDAQVNIKEHTDNLIKHVKEKPLTSLLIAGGIGFILSSLLKK